MAISLKEINAFKTEETTQEIIEISTENELKDAVTKHPDHIVLGKGTNTLFVKNIFIPVLINEFKGIKIQEEDKESITYIIGGGEIWTDVVDKMCEKNLWGLEYLSGIPGSAGAGVVKNIGAYGSELSDICKAVNVYDKEKQAFREIKSKDCKFGYRTSIFEKMPNQYIITDIVITIQKQNKNAEQQFLINTRNRGVGTPKAYTPIEISKEITKTRNRKLPSPETSPNAGSFFKNPILNEKESENILQKHKKLKHWKTDEGTKFSAGELIELCGMKGYKEKTGAGISEKHALVIINNGTKRGNDIYSLSQKIQKEVSKKFKINLEPEVSIHKG